jgi:hypothetical protein
MNIRYLSILFSLFICSCTNERQTKNFALELVENSIEAHGGMEKWQAIRELTYTKNTRLLLPNGELESEIGQIHNYSLRPELTGTIEWSPTDSIDIRIDYNSISATRFINGSLDSAAIGKVENEFMAAYFTLCQPFKLLDAGTELEYLGKDTLEDGKEVEKVMVTYPNAEKSDRWWYFFDPVSYRVVANMVDHGRGYSYIRNLEYDDSTGIVFNRARNSYTVDSARNILYLRATYLNEDFKITLAE